MDLVRVAERAELEAGERKVVEHGEHEVLVLMLNDCIYAVGNICTHDEVWLDDGILHPDSCEIECPMHEGRFDLRTGDATHEPAERPVPTYPVRVVDGEVFVEIA
jgi:nitrite reductase/ring-hydroxylating ferredoxin subunit